MDRRKNVFWPIESFTEEKQVTLPIQVGFCQLIRYYESHRLIAWNLSKMPLFRELKTPAYFSPNYKCFDQILQTVKN